MKSDEIINKIRNKIKESDPEKRTVTNIFQFIFTDSDGACIKKMELNIYEGTNTSAEAEVTISDEDFYSIGTHKSSFDEVIANRKAQINGDADALNKMMEKFRMNQKKF